LLQLGKAFGLGNLLADLLAVAGKLFSFGGQHFHL